MTDTPDSGASREAYIPVSDADFTALLHAFPYPCLARSAVLELRDQRADRVKLQGEIERLTHENADLRAHLNHAGETLLDAADRAEAKQTDIEALAERLSRVEDRLAAFEQIGAKHHRRILALEQAPERFVLHENVQVTSAPLPTGAATTVEEVLEQAEEAGDTTQLVPQRGDRVRLEGAKTLAGNPVIDGWYDVLGHYAATFPGDHTQFQIGDGAGVSARPWVDAASPGLKEVRRGAANLPE